MNAQYVIRHGAAVRVRRPRDAATAVRRLLEDGAAYAKAAAAARALGQPEAADRIVREVIAPLSAGAAHQ